MSTSGTERQFLPFLGDGIAQSLGLVPLIAGSVFDLTPGATDGVRAALGARTRARPHLMPGMVGPTPSTPVVVTFPVADLVVTARPPRGRAPLPLDVQTGATWFLPATPVVVPFPTADLVVRAPTPRAPARFYLASRMVAPIATAPSPAAAAPLLTAAGQIAARQALRYTTDVLTTWSGLENRIAIAAVPLEQRQFTALLTDAELAQVRAQIFADPAVPVLLPIRDEDTPLLADVVTNQLAIDTTLLDWGVAGDQVLVENVAGQAYVATVQSVAGAGPTTVLTVDVLPPIGQRYAAGVARVALLRACYLIDGLGTSRYPVAAGAFEVAALVQPPRVTMGTGATVATFDGLPVFDRRLNANSPSRESSAGGLELIGAPGGAYYARTSMTQSRIRRRARYTIRTAAERQWFRAFLAAARGRQVAFLLPTWTPDLTVAVQPLPAATTLRILATPDYVTLWFPSLAHRHLQLGFADGSIGYVTVTAAVDNGDGTQTLTVTSVGAMTSAIVMVSLLERVRFDQDEFVVTSAANVIGVVDLELLVVQR